MSCRGAFAAASCSTSHGSVSRLCRGDKLQWHSLEAVLDSMIERQELFLAEYKLLPLRAEARDGLNTLVQYGVVHRTTQGASPKVQVGDEVCYSYDLQ